MSKKVFIFDMDGVLVDSERAWEACGEEAFLAHLFGPEIARAIGDNVGISIRTQYEIAKAHGFTMSYDTYIQKYTERAVDVYKAAHITPGADTLVDFLLKHDFHLGLVSSSPMSWINFVLPRLPWVAHLETIISLNDRLDLTPKPAPDGYLQALKDLEVTADHTMILEDSNSGIKSARAAHIYVVGLKVNLIDGYVQTGADDYVDTMDHVIPYIKKRFAL